MTPEQLVSAVRARLDELERIAADGPAAVFLRWVAADRRVLGRHRPQADVCNYCPVVVWPCPDFADLADRLGIDPEGSTP